MSDTAYCPTCDRDTQTVRNYHKPARCAVCHRVRRSSDQMTRLDALNLTAAEVDSNLERLRIQAYRELEEGDQS